MMSERDESQAVRMSLRREYGDLYDRVSHILFKWDPIEINFGHNTDEYEPEVDTILPRLRTCTSADDVQRVVHEEFCRWFDEDCAGDIERYEEISRDIWAQICDRRWDR
jgi:hypothetical protein